MKPDNQADQKLYFCTDAQTQPEPYYWFRSMEEAWRFLAEDAENVTVIPLSSLPKPSLLLSDS